MKDTDTVETRGQLRAALALVSMTGCLDFAWSWALLNAPEGWHVVCEFSRPDRETGVSGRGRGRPLYVAAGSTAREVWGTAFTAIKLIIEHETLESFHVAGARVFDPHTPMVRA